jgi:hypothetical protein
LKGNVAVSSLQKPCFMAKATLHTEGTISSTSLIPAYKTTETGTSIFFNLKITKS